MPPAVRIRCSPAMISVDGPIASPGVTPSWMSGLPALPIAQMRPSRTPTSAFTMPQWSRMIGVGDDEVGRAVGARGLRLPLAVADDLAAAEDDLFAVAREVAFDLEHEGGVAEADAVARGRAVQVRVGVARDLHRGVSGEPATPRARAPRRALVERPVDQRVHAVRVPPPPSGISVDVAAFARLEPQRGAGGDVEPAAVRLRAIEAQAAD